MQRNWIAFTITAFASDSSWNSSTRSLTQRFLSRNAPQHSAPLGWSLYQNAGRALSQAHLPGRTVGWCSLPGQKKRFRDNLKASLKDSGFDHTSWETLDQNRPTWRGAVANGAVAYGVQRTEAAKTRRKARKSRSCNDLINKAPNPHYPRVRWCMKMVLFAQQGRTTSMIG